MVRCDGAMVRCDGAMVRCDGRVRWYGGTVRWYDGTVRWYGAMVRYDILTYLGSEQIEPDFFDFGFKGFTILVLLAQCWLNQSLI